MTGYEGQCRSPCFIASEDTTDGTDECWPANNVDDYTRLLTTEGIFGCKYEDIDSVESIQDADYYCSCDTENGYVVSDESPSLGECIRVALVGG